MFDELLVLCLFGSVVSQMNNLCSDECLYFEILVCENGCEFTNVSQNSYRANHNRSDSCMSY